MTATSKQVDDYMAGLEPDRREALSQVRTLILETVPGATETFKYHMPTYEYRGGVLCAFASQKQYMSLYMDIDLVAKHGEELARLDLGKSCIRFRKLEVLPLDTVRTILEETLQRSEYASDRE
jgi:uncharacterized protein YdhG (YjbR/CyaY superfamily)